MSFPIFVSKYTYSYFQYLVSTSYEFKKTTIWPILIFPPSFFSFRSFSVYPLSFFPVFLYLYFFLFMSFLLFLFFLSWLSSTFSNLIFLSYFFVFLLSTVYVSLFLPFSLFSSICPSFSLPFPPICLPLSFLPVFVPLFFFPFISSACPSFSYIIASLFSSSFAYSYLRPGRTQPENRQSECIGFLFNQKVA